MKDENRVLCIKMFVFYCDEFAGKTTFEQLLMQKVMTFENAHKCFPTVVSGGCTVSKKRKLGSLVFMIISNSPASMGLAGKC